MNQRARLLGYLAALVGLPLLLVAASSQDVQRFFAYGKKPSTGLIEVSLDTTMPAARTQYTLFADGRLLIRKSLLAGSRARLEETLETALGQDELELLVKDVVDSGLATYDPEEASKSLKADPRGLAMSSEPTFIRFQIALDYLAEGSKPAREPFENTFSTSAPPETLARGYPNEKAYASFDRLLKRLGALEKSAREKKQ